MILDYMTKFLSKHDCDGGDDHYRDNDNEEYDDRDDDSDDQL